MRNPPGCGGECAGGPSGDEDAHRRGLIEETRRAEADGGRAAFGRDGDLERRRGRVQRKVSGGRSSLSVKPVPMAPVEGRRPPSPRRGAPRRARTGPRSPRARRAARPRGRRRKESSGRHANVLGRPVPATTSWPLAVAAALVALAALGWPSAASRGVARAPALGPLPDRDPRRRAALDDAPRARRRRCRLSRRGAGRPARGSLRPLRCAPAAAGCFHLLAWPLAPFLGDAAAVRVLAALAFAISLLLVHALARGLGAGAWPRSRPGARPRRPEMREPLLAGRFPAVVGTAGELAVLAHLVRRLPMLEAARDGRPRAPSCSAPRSFTRAPCP